MAIAYAHAWGLLRQLVLDLIDEDEEIKEPAERSYWETRGLAETVAMADQLLEIAKLNEPGLDLKYK